MWQEAIGHVVGCWTNEEHEFAGEFWQMPRRRVQPKPWQKPHPPLWGATTSDEGHAQVGDLGLGLCSFAVGLPPAEVKRKIDIYRDAVGRCRAPIGAFVHDQAATFTMAICAPDRDEAIAEARESFEWYPKTGARQIATLTDWMAERNEDLGTYAYAADMKKTDDEGLLDLLTLEYLIDSNACVLGTPDGVHRGLPPVRGGRRRPPALPGQPVQGPPRVGHADHRADGHRGDPGLRGLSPCPAGAGPSAGCGEGEGARPRRPSSSWR